VKYDDALKNAQDSAVVSDAFIDSVQTARLDGTTSLKVIIFPDLDTETELFKLKKCHVKMVVIPQSAPPEAEGFQKPMKKSKKKRMP